VRSLRHQRMSRADDLKSARYSNTREMIEVEASKRIRWAIWVHEIRVCGSRESITRDGSRRTSAPDVHNVRRTPSSYSGRIHDEGTRS